jgi:hypothetical protein
MSFTLDDLLNAGLAETDYLTDLREGMPLSVSFGECLLALNTGFPDIAVIAPLCVLDDLLAGVHFFEATLKP